MIKVVENEEFDNPNRTLICKCPKCGKLLVQRMGRNGPFIACPDRECGYILRSGKKSEEKTADTAEE